MESSTKSARLGGAVPYLGGKRNLAKRLVPRIQAVPHTCYAEPFVGAGGIFFRRPQPSKVEVINDWNREVYTFFRVLQQHYAYFVNEMRFQIASRAAFDRLVKTDPATLTDLQRAARFYYLHHQSFAGKGRTFGFSTQLRDGFNLSRLEPTLDALHARLEGVTIECLPYGQFIDRWDRRSTRFYLDPPYLGNEADYGKGLFTPDDFQRLADQLARIKGTFLLSLNDRPEVRAIFKGFRIEAVATTYTAGSKRGRGKRVGEVMIEGP